MRYYKVIFSIIIILIFGKSVYSQQDFSDYQFDTISLYRFELLDGSKFLGNYVQKDSLVVVIRTESIPRIEIPFNRIKELSVVDKEHFKSGQYWFPNPNPTRYLFAPSGYNLKKGEGYYQNVWVLFNSFNVGLSDNFSIGGGLEFISTIGSITNDEFSPIFFITPKFGFQVSPKANAGVGLLYINIPMDEDESGGLGIIYGVGTLGSIEHNVTAGIGWGFVQGDFSGSPILTLSGMTRVSRKTSLITENWFIPEGNGSYYPLFSYGLRFFGEKISVDLAFVNNGDIVQGIFLGIPFVDFVVKF